MARPGLSIRERLGAIERRARRFPPIRGADDHQRCLQRRGRRAARIRARVLGPVRGHPGTAARAQRAHPVGGRRARPSERFVDWITTQVPPLANVAEEIVNSVKDSARVGSVIGLVGFLWGASGFYLALENALGRFFPSRTGQGPGHGTHPQHRRRPARRRRCAGGLRCQRRARRCSSATVSSRSCHRSSPSAPRRSSASRATGWSRSSRRSCGPRPLRHCSRASSSAC